MSKSQTAKKLTGSVIIIVILCIMLCVTTFAIIWAMVRVDNNLFNTGGVRINLNDGNPIIEEHEFLFEPGMTVRKDCFIKNNSTWAVYYKIYFSDVRGGLADILEITVKDGDKVLCHGHMNELTRDLVTAAEDQLAVGESKNLSVWFYYPEDAGNEGQGMDLSFSIAADAVQTKNNPDKVFE